MGSEHVDQHGDGILSDLLNARHDDSIVKICVNKGWDWQRDLSEASRSVCCLFSGITVITVQLCGQTT